MAKEPVAGYPSKRTAIMAMLADGLGTADIIAKTGSTEATVHVYRAELKRRHADGSFIVPATLEKIERVERLYPACLDVMAEGLGIDRAQLHGIICSIVLSPKPDVPPMHQAQPAPEPSGAPAESAAGGEPSKSSPAAPSIALDDLRVAPAVERPPTPRPEPARLPPSTIYRLKHPTLEKWLHESCTTLTSDRRWAWKGISARANIVMSKIEAAKDLILDPII
jgi:hypothetical protein